MNHNPRHISGCSEYKRLSEQTHALAERYLTTTEITDSIRNAPFRFVPSTQKTLFQNYSNNIRMIAENAPLRILPEEKLIGAATFLEAPGHACPGGAYGATSHTTVDFAKAVHLGLKGLEREIITAIKVHANDPEKLDFLESLRDMIQSMRIWRDRYRNALKDRNDTEALKLIKILENVPENPPETFPEAVQSLWFFYEFQRLCGNWSGLGRMDKLLGPYLKRDLECARITLCDAREYLAHFWIKGTEWKGIQQGSGDAQHYQNIILGGCTQDISDVTNEVTHLILDIVEELHISDFPIAIRINSQTSNEMFRRIAAIQRSGGGIVSIYNERTVFAAMERFGYSHEDAVEFTNDGCWEVIPGGKTAFTYWPFDALELLQKILLPDDPAHEIDFQDFKMLYSAYLDELKRYIEFQNSIIAGYFNDECRESREKNAKVQPTPTALLSLLVDDCILRGRSYNNRGARYSVAAIHVGGLPDTANSLTALKYFVYDTQKVTLNEMRNILRNDWNGAETLHKEAKNLLLYGNDSAEADAMLTGLCHDYTTLVEQRKSVNSILRPAGISTFGRELAYSGHRKATAFGTRSGEVLAANLAPTPGTDRNGPLAVIRSFCKNDFTKLPNGCPLDLKFHPSAIEGENGLRALVALLKTFCEFGGFYLQIDCADSKILRSAQKHPEKYPNLSVRISGWSARFVTLSREWQEMVIRRTEQKL